MKRIDLLSLSEGREIYIWGARMTGLGAYRWLSRNGIEVVGFIDSDPAFEGISVREKPVLSTNDFAAIYHSSEVKPLIVVAVSLKEAEIRKIASQLKINTLDLFSFYQENSPYFTVDVMGTCNLKCASCPHSIPDHNVPGGVMPLEVFKRVIDKIATEHPDTTHISLYSWGEPLLHPKIDELVKYVHTKGIAVALSSNLSFSFEERLKRLVLAKPDYLKISLSGYFPDAYNSTHYGGDVNLVKSNLYKIRHFIDKFKSDILVDINYHLYRDNNQKNLNNFKRLASELNFMLSTVNALVMPLERVINYVEGRPDQQTIELDKNLLVTIAEGIEASSAGYENETGCAFRENQVNINADLTVPICCTVFQREGNIVAENFLNSNLEDINKNKSLCETCTKCEHYGLPAYNMGYNKEKWNEIAGLKTSLDY